VRNLWPIFFLAALTPCVEFLTGSTSFLGLFAALPMSAIPFVAITLPGYIFPVLLIRDALVAWSKGWASLLGLGIAYGAVNEGLLAKTYFVVNPLSPPLGPGGGLGRWLGVNWPWVTEISLFHMVVSISVPVVLGFLIFPETRAVRFLSRGAIRWMIAFLLVEITAIIALQSIVGDYRSLLPLYPLPIAVVLGGIYLARRMPRPDSRRTLEGGFGRPVPLGLAGLGFFVVMFLPILGFFPIAFVATPVLADGLYRLGAASGVVAAVYPLACAGLAMRFFSRYTLGDVQLLALVTGVMIVPMAHAVSTLDFAVGAPVAAALYLAAILLARSRILKRAESPTTSAAV